MDTIRNFKYKKIEKFLNTSEVNLLKDYCRIRHRINKSGFDIQQSKTLDTMFYGDPLMESLLINKKEKMQELTGLKLLPTYAFWRMYTKFADLKKHSDRPSCEISVTVNIGGDGTSWPFLVDKSSIDLKPGDAVLYLGCEVEHWRDEFQGDWFAQTFLHYVDAEGPYKEYWKDGRLKWGEEKIPTNMRRDFNPKEVK
jgi:hypothetical protein